MLDFMMKSGKIFAEVSLDRRVCLPFLAVTSILLAGCPKANQDYQAGRKAESVQDYDTALVDYERAVRANPDSPEYKLRATRMHFVDGQFHIERGEKALNAGDLQQALAEFEKAQ